MNNFSGFLNMFFNSDFFAVVIVILILVLLMILSYLIKSQKVKITELENKTNMLMNESKMEDTPKEIVKNEISEEVKITPPTNSVLNIESLDNTKANIVLDLSPKKESAQSITYINPIEEYEENEEENAVISAKELEAIEKERDEVLGKDNNAKLIEKYEEDQEKKAIISYNELLKNATSLELKYIEKPKEEENAPIVKQVEIKEQHLVGVEYTAEEEYLKILKEFRTSLISSG